MTNDTDKTPKTGHAEDKTQAAVPLKTSGTAAGMPAGGGEKDSWATITITPPTETMYLYKWYPLTVTCDNDFPWGVFMNTGPETPPPADDKPGHIFMFDKTYAPVGSTINIMAVGPNTDTKVTVYGRSLDSSTPGKADLTFVASDSPPVSSLGVFALNGQPWRMPQENGLPYLVGAVYMDKDGNPLTGEVKWSTTSDTANLLSPAPTLLRANGTSSNGVTVVGEGENWWGVTITASVDGTSLTMALPEFAVYYTDPPNIAFTVDAAQTTLTATCPQFQEGAEVIWEAYPPEKVQLQYRRTKVTKGSATNTIVTTGDAQFTAYFAASTMDTTGQTDHNYLRDYGTLEFQLTPSVTCTIGITSGTDAGHVPLYAGDVLTATVTGSDCGVSAIQWTADAGDDATHEFTFDPNPSQIKEGVYTTTITGRGPNLGSGDTLPVTVYATPVDAGSKVKVPGSLDLTFVQGAVPAGAVMTLVSLDGNELQDGGVYHVFKATYANADGSAATTPGWNKTITWTPPGDGNLTWRMPDPTPTNDEGVATNALKRQSKGNVTVTAQATGISDPAAIKAIPVTFVDQVTPPAGAGTMKIDPVAPPPTVGQMQPLTVTYLDDKNQSMPAGTVVRWFGTPNDRLTFSGGSGTGSTDNVSEVTGSEGKARINVMASVGPAITDAVIQTTAVNPISGTNDHSDPNMTVSFETAPPPSGLLGVQIDKPLARTNLTGQLRPTLEAQIIQCHVQVGGSPPPPTILLTTTNPDLGTATWVKMYTADGTQELARDGQNPDAYTIQPVGGVASFRIASGRMADIMLNANAPGRSDGPSARLALALVSDLVTSPQLPPPVIPELDKSANNLPIPTDRPSFKVIIPTSRPYGLGTFDTVLLLNERVIYEGTIGGQPEGGIDVAYAALKSSGNTLVYLSSQKSSGAVWQSPQPTSSPFKAGPIGNAQTGPQTVGDLEAPTIQVPGSTIAAKDIASQTM
ncbi:hypothetical protein C5748_27110, partial [Phyllobacterium phragmitis]